AAFEVYGQTVTGLRRCARPRIASLCASTECALRVFRLGETGRSFAATPGSALRDAHRGPNGLFPPDRFEPFFFVRFYGHKMNISQYKTPGSDRDSLFADSHRTRRFERVPEMAKRLEWRIAERSSSGLPGRLPFPDEARRQIALPRRRFIIRCYN